MDSRSLRRGFCGFDHHPTAALIWNIARGELRARTNQGPLLWPFERLQRGAEWSPGETRLMPKYPYNAEIGQTDLMGAAFNGDAEEIAHILSMPSDVDAQDDHGLTALMYAAMKGYAEAVQRLIEHGAALELQSARRWTALMYAVRQGRLEAVQVLLRAKADPDVHGDYGTFDTPLTIAADRGHFPIVRALVGAGAEVHRHGGYAQRTAECIARHEGHHEISEFLLYHERRPLA